MKHATLRVLPFTFPYLPQPVLDFLRTALIANPYIFVDYWSILHTLSGAFLGTFRRLRAIHVFCLLAFFELFEFWLMTKGYVRFELLADTIWDLIFGMFGLALLRTIENVERVSWRTEHK